MVDNNIKGKYSSHLVIQRIGTSFGLHMEFLNGGLKGLTEGLAQILIPYGINVNSIAPGSTATGLIGIKEGDSITSEEME